MIREYTTAIFNAEDRTPEQSDLDYFAAMPLKLNELAKVGWKVINTDVRGRCYIFVLERQISYYR